MDKQKHEKILTSYEHHKRLVCHWETAIFKNTGYKPNSDDLAKAPVSIKAAYREYKKLKKYLSSHSDIEKTLSLKEGKEKQTPPKIFSTFQPSSQKEMKKSASFPTNNDKKSKLYKNLSCKLFTVSTSSDWNMNPWRKTKSKNDVNNISTADDSKDSENNEGNNINLPTESTSRNSVESEIDCTHSYFKARTGTMRSKLKSQNQITGLWQNPSVAPCTVTTKKVDESWLERCGIDLDISMENYDDSDEEQRKITNANVSANSSNSVVVSPFKLRSIEMPKSREDIAMNESCFSNNEDNEELSNSLVGNMDSGFSNDFILNISDVRDVLVESLTPGGEDSGMADSHIFTATASGCENETSPLTLTRKSDKQEEAVKEVLSVLSSKTRKRTSSYAFSPSPEKAVPKRKIFKTSRADRDKIRHARTVPPPKASGTKLPSSRIELIPKSKTVEKSHFSEPTDSEKIKIQSIAKPSKVSNKCNNTDAYDDVAQGPSTKYKGRLKLSKEQLLQRKLSTGKINQNYVRIDVSKKVFVRGHKKISGAKVKRNNWKSKQSAALKESKMSTLTCRKCGETGHFGKFCTKGMNMGTTEEPEQIDESPFPTLEEAARMAFSKRATDGQLTSTKLYSKKTEGNVDGEISTLGAAEDNKCDDNDTSESEFQLSVDEKSPDTVRPYFESNGPLELLTEDQEAVLRKTLNLFGYKKFREGQKEAIIRVLMGNSTLVILSTGSGKSLCYQLPAYLYAKNNPGVLTLCISPLVSLMEDQVEGMSPCVQAACLHNNMTTKQKEIVFEKLHSKRLQILLVSPEAICGGLFGILRSGKLPPIAFACIDEVHCVSQWSHNFRPSYLQLCKILREKLNVKTILGLTATATEQTATSICNHIQIDPSTTIRGELIPSNLNLSVSRDVDREEALLNLLRGERFKNCDSIIIYCTRREQCEIIAKFIRINFQDTQTNKGKKLTTRKRVSNNCEAYHAGMSAARRRMVQKLFMNGDIRVVVATVAFGMGIDKADIRAVIHYNMPKTFESYVQEIGRAGRDGLPAQCHLFLENVKGKDLCELKRHVYSDSVDRQTLRKLIHRIFKPCKCSRIAQLSANCTDTESCDILKQCPGHEVSFSVNDTITDLDLPQENIMTLLCYLELNEQRKWIELLPLTYEICKIQCYGGPKLLKTTALKCPPLAVAIALKKEQKKFKEQDSYIDFNVIEIAATVGWNSTIVKRELKNLEWAGTEFNAQGDATKFRKSGLLVEFSELAFRVIAPGNITDEEADSVLNSLHQLNVEQEKTQLHQLNRVYQALFSISSSNVGDACDDFVVEKSDRLKQFIHNYFHQPKLPIEANQTSMMFQTSKEEEIRRDTRSLLLSQSDVKFTGRAVAKIFQGIPSPCFPAEHWARNRSFWRRHLDVDFHTLAQIAAHEILNY